MSRAVEKIHADRLAAQKAAERASAHSSETKVPPPLSPYIEKQRLHAKQLAEKYAKEKQHSKQYE